MLTLNTPIEKINKIGKATAGKLHRLDIKTVQDLLEYYPYRYDDYASPVKITNLQPGAKVSVQGVIEFIHNKRTSRQRKFVTECLINDESDQLKVV